MRKWLLLLSFFVVNFCFAQGDGYKTPPKAIADLLLAKPTPGVSIDEKGTWMLLMDRNSLPSVEELAQPELKIAGLSFSIKLLKKFLAAGSEVVGIDPLY